MSNDEFSFKECGHLQVASDPDPSLYSKGHYSLLSCSVQYGVILCGYKTMLRVAESKVFEEAFVSSGSLTENPQWLFEYDVKLKISHIAVNADSSLASVVTNQNGTKLFLFAFPNISAPIKDVQVSPNCQPTHAAFSPVDSALFAVSLDTENKLLLCHIDSAQVALSVRLKVDDVTLFAWSPKGKQLLLALSNGGVRQVLVNGTLKRDIPPLGGAVTGMMWISTYHLLISYSNREDTNVVVLQTQRDTKIPPQRIDIKDELAPILSTSAQMRSPGYYFNHVDALGSIFALSHHSLEVNVFLSGSNSVAEVNPSFRAQLKLSDDSSSVEPLPIGAALDFTCCVLVQVSEEKYLRCPIYIALSNLGIMSAFSIVYPPAFSQNLMKDPASKCQVITTVNSSSTKQQPIMIKPLSTLPKPQPVPHTKPLPAISEVAPVQVKPQPPPPQFDFSELQKFDHQIKELKCCNVPLTINTDKGSCITKEVFNLSKKINENKLQTVFVAKETSQLLHSLEYAQRMCEQSQSLYERNNDKKYLELLNNAPLNPDLERIFEKIHQQGINIDIAFKDVKRKYLPGKVSNLVPTPEALQCILTNNYQTILNQSNLVTDLEEKISNKRKSQRSPVLQVKPASKKPINLPEEEKVKKLLDFLSQRTLVPTVTSPNRFDDIADISTNDSWSQSQSEQIPQTTIFTSQKPNNENQQVDKIPIAPVVTVNSKVQTISCASVTNTTGSLSSRGPSMTASIFSNIPQSSIKSVVTSSPGLQIVSPISNNTDNVKFNSAVVSEQKIVAPQNSIFSKYSSTRISSSVTSSVVTTPVLKSPVTMLNEMSSPSTVFSKSTPLNTLFLNSSKPSIFQTPLSTKPNPTVVTSQVNVSIPNSTQQSTNLFSIANSSPAFSSLFANKSTASSMEKNTAVSINPLTHASSGAANVSQSLFKISPSATGLFKPAASVQTQTMTPSVFSQQTKPSNLFATVATTESSQRVEAIVKGVAPVSMSTPVSQTDQQKTPVSSIFGSVSTQSKPTSDASAPLSDLFSKTNIQNAEILQSGSSIITSTTASLSNSLFTSLKSNSSQIQNLVATPIATNANTSTLLASSAPTTGISSMLQNKVNPISTSGFPSTTNVSTCQLTSQKTSTTVTTSASMSSKPFQNIVVASSSASVSAQPQNISTTQHSVSTPVQQTSMFSGFPSPSVTTASPFGKSQQEGPFGNATTVSQKSAPISGSSPFGNVSTASSPFGNVGFSNPQQSPFAVQQAPAFGTSSVFGGNDSTQKSPFANNSFNNTAQPVFGSPSSSFSNLNQPTFGGSAVFGSNLSNNSSFGGMPSKVFGSSNQTNSGGVFGSNISGSVFGGGDNSQSNLTFGALANQTNSNPPFGSQTPSFGNTFNNENNFEMSSQNTSNAFTSWR